MKRCALPWRRFSGAAVALASLAFGQGQAWSLTLAEAMRQALSDHPGLMQKRHAADAAEQDLKAAEWQRYPTLSVETNARVGSSQENRDSGGSGGTVVRVDQPLWAGGRIDADIRAVERRRDVARLSLQEAEVDLLTRTVSAYCDVWRWQKRVEAAQDNEHEQERLYQMIRRRTDQEVSSEIDASLAQARWQQAQTERLGFQASLTVALSALQQVLGVATTPEETVVLPDSDPVAQQVDELLRATLDYSPMLQRLNMEADVARAEASAKAASVYPTVLARYEHVNSNGPARPYDQAMVVLSYQPGAGLSAMNVAEAAQRRLLAAQDARLAGERDVADRLRTQLAEAQSYARQKGGTLAYAKAMSDVMASYLRQYAVGRKSWLEVLNAQRDVATSRYSAIDIVAGLTAARLKLDLLTGRLNRDKLTEQNP